MIKKLFLLMIGGKRKRTKLIAEAFDHVLKEALPEKQAADWEPSVLHAQLAVKLSTMSCGPTARNAEAYLKAHGMKGIEFHSLGGHFVLLDTFTGLLHDMETYAGCKRKEELPIWNRELAMQAAANNHQRDQIQLNFAYQWLTQHRLNRTKSHNERMTRPRAE